MLTNEHLANLENLAKKTAPDTWDNFELDRILFSGGLEAYDNYAYMSAAHPTVILEMIEELRQARKKETQPNSYNGKKFILVLPVQDGEPLNTFALIYKVSEYIKKNGGRIIFNYTGRHYTHQNGEKEKGTQQEIQDLARAIDNLAECDAVCFLKGWQAYIGCRILFDAAKAYGIDIEEEV